MHSVITENGRPRRQQNGKARGPKATRDKDSKKMLPNKKSAILDQLYNSYGLESGDRSPRLLKEAILNRNRAIDFNFELNPNLEAASIPFQDTHVEAHLDQMADYLERAVRTRQEWEELNVRRELQELELLEFALLDDIHGREIADEIYKVPFKQSSSTRAAEEIFLKRNDAGISHLDSAIKELKETFDNHVEDAANLAWAACYPTLAKDMAGPEQWYKFPFATQAQPVIQSMFVRAAKKFELKMEGWSLESQRFLELAQREKSAALLAGLSAKSGWDKVDEGYRLERRSVAQNLFRIKKAESESKGGALNYRERMHRLAERCESDLNFAIMRAEPASRGLQNLYGYSVPLPKSILSLLESKDPPSRQYIDDLLIWVRKAISWRVAFVEAEQSYVLPVSVRSYSRNWAEGLKAGRWMIDINDKAINQLFAGAQRHIRLRGISIIVHGKNISGIWQAAIKAPQKSFCQHLDDPSQHDLLQLFPECLSARVSKWEDIREPDIVGVSALHNGSPFGVWELNVSKKSTAGYQTEDLDDIYIHFHLAFCTQR
jgi:hypothetical protein